MKLVLWKDDVEGNMLPLLSPKYQVCIMIHSGSRGLGHQVATDALVAMETAMARDKIKTNDRQLACAKINSKVGGNIKRRTCRSKG